MLMSVVCFTSCLNTDETETTVYDDMAISGFSLATVNRYIHTTSKSGTDSVYKSTLTTKPTFTIDQKQFKIYNTDSLPNDCDLKHVLATITSSTYSGSIYIKSLVSDTLWVYSSSDSIDLSQPRELRVYNNTYEKYRAYELTVNKHQVETEKILWEQMSADAYPTDTDKKMWEQRVADAGLKSFIGAGTKEAYAFNQEGRIMVTTDEGATWTPDNVDDDDLPFLPKQEIAFVSYPFTPNEDTDYQMMTGIIEEGEVISVVWRKIAEYAEGSQPSKWVMVPFEVYNRYYLPAMNDFNLVWFNGSVLAIDSNWIRSSRDGGITWKTSDILQLPSDNLFSVEAYTDDEGALWIKDKTTDNVWRGIYVEE